MMKRVGTVFSAIQDGINFVNASLLNIVPYSVLFFVAAFAYSITWYVLDTFNQVACLNGNYLIELLFCNLYLGVLGKHIISVLLSSFVIIPFAALVYSVHNSVMGKNESVLDALNKSINGIVKIVIFRGVLVLLLFSPFILFLVVGGDIITSKITSTGRLTVEKMLTTSLLPIPAFLLFGFTMLALLEPMFQYVEFEVLVNNARVRDAVKNSYSLAMRYKLESFIFGFLCIFVWTFILVMKLIYLVHPLLVISLVAAVFLESFLIFPVRTISLYFLWRKLRGDLVAESEAEVRKTLKSYVGKMLLG